jgi:DNA end-binding protein Ku
MARTIWKGSLSFGLVNVPVGLYPATQDKSIHFNQFEKGTADRIRYKKVNERTGKEVESANIVKGVDVGGQFVILSDEELAAAEPERSRQIEITDFVDLDEIDPVFYRTTYYVAPEGKGSDKPYALLRKAMQESRKVAIATLVMRNKEYLVAIRPESDVLALETMFFADEVRSADQELPRIPNDADLSEREISMANVLIDSMQSTWDPDRFHDTHREKVEALIEAKSQGQTIVPVKSAPAPKVVDLLEALQASISASQSNREEPASKAPGSKTAAKKAPRKRAPASKPAAKKASAPESAAKKTSASRSVRKAS